MTVIVFLWVALKVGLAWFVLLLALFQPPLSQVPRMLRICLLGMVICGPAGYFNTYWLEALSLKLGHENLTAVALLWILVAPVEELLKYAIVRSAVGRAPRIEHPREACMLAACSALGFATYENYFYMTMVGPDVINVRGWLCTAGHMLWSSVWGYYLGLAWMGRAPAKLAVAEGIILAALAHGTYNFLCTRLPSGVGFLVPILAIVLLGDFFKRRLWTGKHTPWLATATHAGVSLSRLRFPEREEHAARARELAPRLDADDEELRIAAAKEAVTCEHQAILEQLRALERDPVPEVRAAAIATTARLASRLRAVGERVDG